LPGGLIWRKSSGSVPSSAETRRIATTEETRRELERLLDPAPLDAESAWRWLPDGVGHVAVRTAMPGVTAEMIDWWFDWHPRDPARYRLWYPEAHFGITFDPPAVAGAKLYWGAVHHPDEDVGTGRELLRIAFLAPAEFGFRADALADAAVGTIVCGTVGSHRRHARFARMAHVFLNTPDGLVLRSRFWLGAGLRPDLPGALGDVAGRLIDRPFVRRRVIPRAAPEGLAAHCAHEYARLAALLPALHAEHAGE
jgi:hypothetical protein